MKGPKINKDKILVSTIIFSSKRDTYSYYFIKVKIKCIRRVSGSFAAIEI